MTKPETEVDRFHAHLAECPQCERNPFDLCPDGRKLIERAGTALTNPPPPFRGDR